MNASTANQQHGHTILIVDDTPQNLTLLGELLQPAYRLAHTLKGVSGQIGAGLLRDQAARIEQALQQHAPETTLAPMQAEIADTLGALIAAIGQQLPKEAPSPAAEAFDTARFREVSVRLAKMLAEDDFAACHLLDEQAALLRSGLGEHYPWITEAVQDFNFSAALDWLKEAAAARGIKL